MQLHKVGHNLYTVTFQGKVRFFTSKEDAKAYMHHVENKFLRLE